MSIKSAFQLFGGILLLSACAAAADPEKLDPGRVTVTLVPEKAAIMPGEPVWLSLVAKVKSAPDFGLWYPPASNKWAEMSYHLIVRGEDGRKAPRAGFWLDLGEYHYGPPRIPSGKPPFPAEYTYRLFLPFAASLQKPGTYTITAREELAFYKYPNPKEDDAAGGSKTSRGYTSPFSVPVEATAKIEVTQPDDKKMGALIDDLAKRAALTADSHGWEDAYMELQSIPDERVIPYFLQSLKDNNGNLKINALRVLAQFNNDAALAGLKEGMAPASPKVTNRSPVTVRCMAAIGLLNSPHPGAIPLLLTYLHDGNPGVRRDVVEALGTKVAPEKAIPILKEMAKDKDKDVSDDAKKYLKQLAAKEKQDVTPPSQ